MAKRKFYSFLIIFISVVLTLMITMQAGDTVYGDVTLDKNGNHWIYDVDTPLDLYGSDESTTAEIQTVTPGSTFQVTYLQYNSDLISTMVNVLSNLDQDTISGYSSNISVYFILPSEVVTSEITKSSFTLEGSYSLFDIDDVAIEQIEMDQNQYYLVSLELTSKTSYTSIDSMLSAWQDAGTEGKIILSGLTAPSQAGDIFYVSAIPQGTVNAAVGDLIYQFEPITHPSVGDDGMTDSFIDGDTDLNRAHVTFKVSKTTTYSDVDASLKWVENDGTTADTSEHETVYLKLYRRVNGSNSAAENAEAVEGAELKKIETASGENTVKVIWSGLPETNSAGQEYTYYVKEVDSNGNDYTPAGYSKIEDGLVVTNIKDIDYADVTAAKKWVEHDGTTADKSSHPVVYFKLYRSVDGGDPEAVSGAEIKKIKTKTGKSSTKVTWTNLPETNSAGQEYTYSVKEVDADGNDYTPSGYTKTEDGLTVTNKLKKSSTSDKTTDNPDSTDSGLNGKNKNSSTSNNVNGPKTGDTSSIALWVSLLIISAALIAVIYYRKRRNSRKNS